MFCQILIFSLTLLIALSTAHNNNFLPPPSDNSNFQILPVNPSKQPTIYGKPHAFGRPVLTRRSADSFQYPAGVQIEALPLEQYKRPADVEIEERPIESDYHRPAGVEIEERYRRRRNVQNFKYPEGVQIEALSAEQYKPPKDVQIEALSSEYRRPAGIKVEELPVEYRRSAGISKTYLRKDVLP